MMYGLPQNYNPYAPPRPNTPPTSSQTDVPLVQFKAAQSAGASHLSADGKYVYTIRYGQVLSAKWDEWTRAYGAWEPVEVLPADAVVIERSGEN